MSSEARLTVLSTTPKRIELRLPDGTPIYYMVKSADGSGAYSQELPYSADSWIETTATGFFRVLRRGGSETYDSAGRLQEVTDPSGRSTLYARDTQGRLTTITRENRTVTFVYDTGVASRIGRILGPDGVTPLVVYTYDTAGRFQGVDYPGVANSGYRFYFESGQSYARITRVTDAAVPSNPIEEHAYDSAGRATTSEIADGKEKLVFDYATPGQTKVTDARDNVTVYEWRLVDHLPRVARVTGPCSGCGGGPGETRAWAYDSVGRILSYADGSGTTTYTYDALTGDLLAESRPLGHTTTYTYWPDGRVKKRESPNGGVTEFTYVAAGPDLITETVDPSPASPRVTDLDYDAGRLKTITDPRGKKTEFSYDTRGDLVAVTDPLGTATPNDPDDHVTHFEYDDLGRRTAVVDPLGHRVETTYDARGHVLRVRRFDGTRPIDTTHTYDAAGRRTAATDANGRTTDYQYDAYGRLWHVLQPLEQGVRPTTTYAYDVMSNLTSITDAEGRVTSFVRDAYNRVEKVIYPGPREEVFTFDTAGRLHTRARGGVTTTYGYDVLSRLTSKTFSDGTPTQSYVYDEHGDLGYLTSASNAAATLAWDYDLAGQLRTETSQPAGGQPSTVAYDYDGAGNRNLLKLDGVTLLTYEYDDASRLDKIRRGTDVFDFDYDDAGRRERLAYPNGLVTTFVHDDLSRLTHLETLNSTVLNATYTHDDVDNRLTKLVNGVLDDYSQGYEALYRLTAVNRDGSPAEGYTYDRVGNRKTALGNPTTWSYNARNELESNGVASFTYDLRGNLATKTEGADVWLYTWNAQNELTGVAKNGATVGDYKYDPLGRRVEKVAGGVTTRYTYDGQSILRETTSGGGATVYVHGPGVDEPLAKDVADAPRGTTVSYYHADGLGSIVRLTTPTGTVTATWQYDTFGNQQISGGAGYGFTGREWDGEIGLYYYRARYYDPKVGRFISEDPIGLLVDTNLYAYVGNNPVFHRDPYGLDPLADDPDVRQCFCQLWKKGGYGMQTTEAGMDLMVKNGRRICVFWPFTNQTRKASRPAEWSLGGVIAIAHTHPRSGSVQRPSDPGDYKVTVDDYVLCAGGVFKAGKGCTKAKDKTPCTEQPGPPNWYEAWCK
jgi:RHS repeat-associated protein